MMSMSKVASLALAAVSLCESEAKLSGSKARPLSQFRLRMRERATHAAEARARSPMPSLIPHRTQRDTMKQCETANYVKKIADTSYNGHKKHTQKENKTI